MPKFIPHPALAITPEMDADAACQLLGVTVEDVLQELRARQQLKRAQMHREMVLAAQVGRRRRVMRKGGMDARNDLMIHKASYHYWGQRLGYACWDDDQGRQSFVEQYRRDNDAARIELAKSSTVSFAGCPGLANRKLHVQGKPSSREDRLVLKTG